MDKKFIICAVVILILAFFALIANHFFEIYPRKTQKLPSFDVLTNEFYAMELWLKETGHPFRVESFFLPEEISEIPEKTALIFAGSANWENANEYLLPWIENGNSLVVFYNDYFNSIDDEYLNEFINGLGIEVEINSSHEGIEEYGIEIPYFDRMIHFIADEKPDTLIIKDAHEQNKFVQLSRGKGKFIITGHPYFMKNDLLGKEVNARLAWELTGAQTTEENPGVLFVHRQWNMHGSAASNSLFGKIMERGNLVPVIISAFLVILFGFWSVIPIFGIVFHEKQKTSRPIRERFFAEIKFLKKYNALNYYTETYERELQQESKQENENYNYGEIINKIRSVYDGTDKFKRGSGSFKT